MKIQGINVKLIKLNNLVERKSRCERALKDIVNLRRNKVSIYLSVGMNRIEYLAQDMKILIEKELKKVIKEIEKLN